MSDGRSQSTPGVPRFLVSLAGGKQPVRSSRADRANRRRPRRPRACRAPWSPGSARSGCRPRPSARPSGAGVDAAARSSSPRGSRVSVQATSLPIRTYPPRSAASTSPALCTRVPMPRGGFLPFGHARPTLGRSPPGTCPSWPKAGRLPFRAGLPRRRPWRGPLRDECRPPRPWPRRRGTFLPARADLSPAPPLRASDGFPGYRRTSFSFLCRVAALISEPDTPRDGFAATPGTGLPGHWPPATAPVVPPEWRGRRPPCRSSRHPGGCLPSPCGKPPRRTGADRPRRVTRGCPWRHRNPGRPYE